MSVTLSPDDLRALGYDPVASAKAGRAVKLEYAPPATKRAKAPRPYAPYHSKWEQQYAAHLDLLKTIHLVAEWHYEPDTLVCAGGTKYTPDFRVHMAAGPVEYHEVKGYFRSRDRVRVREARAVSPYPIVLVSRAKGAWVYKRLEVAA